MGHSQSVGNENYCYAYLKRNCTFLKIDFPFYSSFMFLGGEKKAPQPSCPHLHTLPAVSWHVLNLQRLFATPPSPQCAPWFSSVLRMHSTDLGRRTARIPHCHIARNSFTALETHRAPPMHPSQTLATTDFFVSTGLPLPRMSQN